MSIESAPGIEPEAGSAPPAIRPVASNVLWNWAGMAVGVLAGFVLAPCLVRGLGETGYGLWILIGSFTGAFGLLDLGVRGSVGRNIAFLRSKGDFDGVNRVLSTAIAALCTISALTVALAWLLQRVFFRLFEVPLAEAPAVRTALLIVAINLGLAFLANLFDAVLWAGQRFDILNKIDIPVALVRVGLTFLLVELDYGLVALAILTLSVTVVAGALKALASFRHDPHLAVRLGFVSKQAARCLYSYGIWVFLVSLAALLLPQLGPLIVGSQLAVALVTPFSVAARLVAWANQIVAAGTGVLTPVMTGLHGAGDRARFREVFIKASMYCVTLTLFLCGLLLVLGRSFIGLWMGDHIATTAGPLLCVLVLGELMPMSQAITYGAVLGMNRHRFWAIMGVVQLVASAAVGIGLARSHGLLGVAVVLAVSASCCRGLIQAVYPCRLIGLTLRAYFVRCLLPPLGCAGVPVALLALVTWIEPPSTWLVLVVYTSLYILAFFLSALAIPAYAELRERAGAVIRARPSFR